MLPKKSKLPRAKFSEAIKKSKRVEGENFSIRIHFVPKTENSRYSVVVSSKISKKAVERNRLKRQIYEVLAKVAPKTGLFGIIYPKKTALNLDFKAINKEISAFFK